MATIAATAMTGSGSRAVTVTTLGASDVFTYVKGSILILNNVSAGALTPNFDGDGATTLGVAGVGDIDLTAGYTAPSIGAGESAAIPLDTIKEYLVGETTVTGGDAIEAQLLTF